MITGKLFDRRFFRFILVGVINTIVGSVIMFALYNAAQVSYWVSSACSYVFTSVLSFSLNKYFTFEVKTWSAFMVTAFIINICVCYVAAYGVAKPAVNHFLKDAPQTIRENIALLAGMCLFTGLNYTGQRLLVFRENKVKE
jgi:putative flippase GtrA